MEDAAGVAFWAEFEAPVDVFGTVRVPLARFRPRFRGRWLDGPALDPGAIVALGFMCYDGRDGPFRLELARISAE